MSDVKSAFKALTAEQQAIVRDCRVAGERALSPEGESVPTWRGAGCAECNGRGYSSRVGIFEMMDLNEDIRKLIMNNEDASVLTRAARGNGRSFLVIFCALPQCSTPVRQWSACCSSANFHSTFATRRKSIELR